MKKYYIIYIITEDYTDMYVSDDLTALKKDFKESKSNELCSGILLAMIVDPMYKIYVDSSIKCEGLKIIKEYDNSF